MPYDIFYISCIFIIQLLLAKLDFVFHVHLSQQLSNTVIEPHGLGNRPIIELKILH